MKTLTVCAFCALAIGVSATCRAADNAGATKEEKITLDQCPAKVAVAVSKAAETSTLKELRKVGTGETVTYVADLTLTLDSEGNVVKKGQLSRVGPAGATTPITVDCAGMRLQEVCTLLSKASGWPVTCGNSFADKPVTLSVKGKPLAEVVQEVAKQAGCHAEPRDGGYRFRTGAK